MEPIVESLKDGPNVIKGPLKLVDARGKETLLLIFVDSMERCG